MLMLTCQFVVCNTYHQSRDIKSTIVDVMFLSIIGSVSINSSTCDAGHGRMVCERRHGSRKTVENLRCCSRPKGKIHDVLCSLLCFMQSLFISVKDGAVMFSMCIFLEYQSYMYKGSKLLITVTAVSNVGSNIFMVYLRPCPCY